MKRSNLQTEVEKEINCFHEIYLLQWPNTFREYVSRVTSEKEGNNSHVCEKSIVIYKYELNSSGSTV